jgi:hypothetical protein
MNNEELLTALESEVTALEARIAARLEGINQAKDDQKADEGRLAQTKAIIDFIKSATTAEEAVDVTDTDEGNTETDS